MELERIESGSPAGARATLLFVHGICHGAWCWENFLDYFAEKGCYCVAVSLRGHCGSEGRDRLYSYTLDDYTEDIRRTVETLSEKPVLIGHSMGGALAQKYTGLYPETLRETVLLCAPPANGMGFGYKLRRTIDDFTGMWYFMLTAYGKALSPEHLNRCAIFGNRLGRAEAAAVRQKLQPESRRAIRELSKPYTDNFSPGIPVHVVGSRDDRIFPEEAQNITGRAYGVAPLLADGLCHDIPLDPEWYKAADIVAQALGLDRGQK